MTSQPNPSTVSFQSATTVSSSSPLSSRPQQPAKDYAAALGALQSRYGSGGAILPSPKVHSSKKLPEPPQASPATSATPSLNGQSITGGSQITLASTSAEESDSANSGNSSSAATRDNTKKKSKTGSILKSIFKGKAKET